MIGSHRDSWTLGSIDPSSAQSVLLEVARSLITLKKTKKWSPKRTIMFLSWDAEEYGLVGSTEWIEEYGKKLTDNGIIYINTDLVYSGNYSYDAKASPTIHSILLNLTKRIKLFDENVSVYERWLENNPNEEKSVPKINSILGSGSDHTSFLQRVGIPCIDHRFVRSNVCFI
jgi:N-acetylated-alpha-linked acidic dipeptidase